MPKPKLISLNSFIAVLCVLFPIALQIQITLFADADYKGLRINLADTLLPLAGLTVAASLLMRKSLWPRFISKHTYLWIAVLIVIFSISLLNGYLASGTLSQWAFLNKYLGFLILICYLALGAWLGTNIPKAKALENIVKITLFTFVSTLVALFIFTFIQPHTVLPFRFGLFPWEGFMANRNAFMILALFAYSLFRNYDDRKSDKRSAFSKTNIWLRNLMWISLPVFLIYNGSRTAWIFGGILMIIFLFQSRAYFFKVMGPRLLLGVIIITAILTSGAFAEKKGSIQLKNQWDFMVSNTTKLEPGYVGDSHRLISWKDSFDLIKQSNTFIGAGMGQYKEFQIEKRGQYIDIIDNTPLWILTEFGILGFAAIGGFFLFCLISLYKHRQEEHHGLRITMLTFLIIVAGMSLLHELLYTRFLWFFIGLSLSIPLHLRKQK